MPWSTAALLMASKKVKGLRTTIHHLERELAVAQRATAAEQKAAYALAEMVGQYRRNLKTANHKRHDAMAEVETLTEGNRELHAHADTQDGIISQMRAKIDELRLRNNTMHQRAQAAESRAIKAERSMDLLAQRHTFWQRHHPSTPKVDEAEAEDPPAPPVWPELGGDPHGGDPLT